VTHVAHVEKIENKYILIRNSKRRRPPLGELGLNGRIKL
jgi:ribosomal protein S24E